MHLTSLSCVWDLNQNKSYLIWSLNERKWMVNFSFCITVFFHFCFWFFFWNIIQGILSVKRLQLLLWNQQEHHGHLTLQLSYKLLRSQHFLLWKNYLRFLLLINALGTLGSINMINLLPAPDEDDVDGTRGCISWVHFIK